MDDIGRWNAAIQAQLPVIGRHETNLTLNITVPLEANMDLFRVGWDLQRPGKYKWVAISTGLAVWSRNELGDAAQHIEILMDTACQMLEGPNRSFEG